MFFFQSWGGGNLINDEQHIYIHLKLTDEGDEITSKCSYNIFDTFCPIK